MRLLLNTRTSATRVLSLVGILGYLALTSCTPSAKSNLANAALIPQPESVTGTGGWFEIPSAISLIDGGNPSVAPVASQLSTALATMNISAGKETGNPTVTLTITEGGSTGKEGYSLKIETSGIEISASDPAGLFYGTQTLIQLISQATQGEQPVNRIPTGEISDKPSYEWRGSMLDVARHFFPVADVKRYIDLISHYKMNVLHLHLSDDQGWRIEIKSWPDLATIGGSTQVGGGRGGYYTQEDYKEIVAYAATKNVTIIPEIDLPGHINAALASYGELNPGIKVPAEGLVTNARKEKDPANPATDLYGGIEVGWSTLSLQKEKTFTFIDDVVRELAAITPGPYLHIGGDEAHATKKEDYITFIDEITQIVKKHDKVMVGWEEIAQGAIDENAIAQFWNSEKYAQQAVGKGARVIMSPSKRAYLDMQYDSTSRIGLHWAAYIEVDDAYQWDPATMVNGIARENILGVEAPLWTETVVTMEDIEYLVFPRLTCIAEVAWTPSTLRDWNSFSQRLGQQASHFKWMGIHYYPSARVPWNP